MKVSSRSWTQLVCTGRWLSELDHVTGKHLSLRTQYCRQNVQAQSASVTDNSATPFMREVYPVQITRSPPVTQNQEHLYIKHKVQNKGYLLLEYMIRVLVELSIPLNREANPLRNVLENSDQVLLLPDALDNRV